MGMKPPPFHAGPTLAGVTVAGSAAGKAGDGPWELCMPTGAERWRW